MEGVRAAAVPASAAVADCWRRFRRVSLVDILYSPKNLFVDLNNEERFLAPLGMTGFEADKRERRKSAAFDRKNPPFANGAKDGAPSSTKMGHSTWRKQIPHFVRNDSICLSCGTHSVFSFDPLRTASEGRPSKFVDPNPAQAKAYATSGGGSRRRWRACRCPCPATGNIGAALFAIRPC